MPAAQTPVPPDYSQQAYVVEHFLQSQRFENDGTGREEQEARIKVISETGVQALGQLKLGYSAFSEKLEIVYVRVRKPDGTVITAQDSAIQDLTIPDAPVYTDFHQKHISVPSLRPGDTLEFRYVRTIVNPLIPGQFWTSYNFTEQGIVLDEQFEINVPKDRADQAEDAAGLRPQDHRGRRSADLSLEPFAHQRRRPLKKKRRSAEAQEPPAIQLTTFQSWEQLGDWYRSLEKDRREPTEAIKAKADSLVQGKSDDMAKVKALYDYVSRDFRYVSLSLGMGVYQPHAAAEILSVGYGDCKDKNTLLAALLQAEGFQSTSVLINALRKIDPDFVAVAIRSCHYPRSSRRAGDLAGQHVGRSAFPDAVFFAARQRGAGRASGRQARAGANSRIASLPRIRSQQNRRLAERHRQVDSSFFNQRSR